MKTATKIKLCVLGDLMLLVLFAAYVPWLWLKVVLMTLVIGDLVLGLRRVYRAYQYRREVADLYYDDAEEFDDQFDDEGLDQDEQ